MGKAGDILFDENGVLLIKNGDMVIGDATSQLHRRLITCEMGENTLAPIRGVGVGSWVLDEADGADLKKKIQGEFEEDGNVIDTLEIDAEEVVVKAKYVR